MANFRNFLLRLSEDLTSKNVTDMKFLLGGPGNVIPDGQLEKVRSATELFELLTLKQLLSAQNIATLKFLIKEIQRLDLLHKLDNYEENNTTPPCDEDHLKSPDVAVERVCLEDKSCGEENEDDCEGQVSPPFNKTSPVYDELFDARKDYLSTHQPTEVRRSTSSSPLKSSHLITPPPPSLIKPSTSPTPVLRPPSYFEKKSPNLPRLNIDARPEYNTQRSSQCVRPEEYDMSSDPHGDCIIISNRFEVTVKASNSDCQLRQRNGTEKDEEVLKETFEFLKFEVTTYTDLSASDITETLRFYASQKEQEDKDCFVCCILSHGYEGGVYGNDGMAMDTKSIKGIFSGDNCPSLLMKPKLFFIQACQGESDSRYVRLESDGAQSSDGNSSPITQDHLSMIEVDAPPPIHCYKEYIAADADILFFMATTPGTISWRHPDTGSWFVQTLCQVFRKFSTWTLMEMLLKVNDLISKKNEDIGDNSGTMAAQMSNIRVNTLRKQLHFFPENYGRKISGGSGKVPAET